MMKRLFATLLALTMVLSLAACGGKKDQPAASNPAAATVHTSPRYSTGEVPLWHSSIIHRQPPTNIAAAVERISAVSLFFNITSSFQNRLGHKQKR